MKEKHRLPWFLDALLTRQEQAALGALLAMGMGGLLVQEFGWRINLPAGEIRSSAQARERKIRVNAASAGELAALPAIGPALAERIVQHRRMHGFFLMPEDLLRVKGIGPKTLSKLKEHLRFD